MIEDDYDAEFRYDRRPVGTLQGLAPDRVLGMGSVSKTLVPMLRLGWIACPPTLLPGVIDEKRLLGPRRAGAGPAGARRAHRVGPLRQASAPCTRALYTRRRAGPRRGPRRPRPGRDPLWPGRRLPRCGEPPRRSRRGAGGRRVRRTVGQGLRAEPVPQRRRHRAARTAARVRQSSPRPRSVGAWPSSARYCTLDDSGNGPLKRRRIGPGRRTTSSVR